jgi:hypothetical protein
MWKSALSKTVLMLLLVVTAVSGRTARAAGTNPGSSPSANPTGQITGTDPEPIDPGLVNLVLALLGLA